MAAGLTPTSGERCETAHPCKQNRVALAHATVKSSRNLAVPPMAVCRPRTAQVPLLLNVNRSVRGNDIVESVVYSRHTTLSAWARWRLPGVESAAPRSETGEPWSRHVPPPARHR